MITAELASGQRVNFREPALDEAGARFLDIVLFGIEGRGDVPFLVGYLHELCVDPKELEGVRFAFDENSDVKRILKSFNKFFFPGTD